MRCGVYGKLPAKRDFVALAAPPRFLGVWEPWLQGAVAASRDELGAAWLAAFLRAPIWRFWLGAEICGTTAAGAFMPSVDGVGRYFPLTVLACAEPGTIYPHPELDPQVEWFGRIEHLLLSVLEDGADFDRFKVALDRIDPPSPGRAGTPPEVAIRAGAPAPAESAATCWWTAGGDGFAPCAMTAAGMPRGRLFTGMLTGEIGPSAADQCAPRR